MDQVITDKLTAKLKPTYLNLVDLSAGKSCVGGSYKLVIQSEKFEGLKLLARQRLVYDALDEEMKSGAIHALEMKCLCPGDEIPK
mmetsp:Transcript_5615/g.10008  ORF Transcript_5615/g.10008 Transcript_5615/m.10008 type:complete len:85 (+) Transcript_5615:59-313(+)